jgi:1,4-dihydroxy-2-naphthoyl-CoA hydrolase
MKGFTYSRQVRLHETDATGGLYFAEQFKMALEAFEEYLVHSQFPLAELIRSSYLFPVVHAEADYMAPVKVGDQLLITLSIERVGTKSATFSYDFSDAKRQACVGTAKIVHAVVDRLTGSSIPIPELFKHFLQVENNFVDQKDQNFVTMQ